MVDNRVLHPEVDHRKVVNHAEKKMNQKLPTKQGHPEEK